ncbi:hypothetical protein OQJ26_18555 [Legionella sp. PATHC038]|uniref:hypothetical protein n=1 Tax=Legionella sheltonii TaxID=2992041 RepID=UPI002242F5D7|nr:hypothetical protein [Legionella sp. PATHC038]MCW8400787.1 hypothetical protein [Legionella sp. PATHC038]
MGLWNTKKESPLFFMPKVDTALPKGFTKESLKPKLEEFILALKKLNELGYAHPDLANDHRHNSPQNMLTTAEGIRLIDLDSGFLPYKQYAATLEPTNPSMVKFKERTLVAGRDQWIYVYNYNNPPEGRPRNEWRSALDKWYDQNKNKTLSDNPQALLSLCKRGELSLPKSFVNELHKKNAQESIAEYRAGSTKDREHTFREVSASNFNCAEYKKEYQELRGDALKRAILKSLKDSLADVTTIEDVKKLKTKFLTSPEMEVINKAQGRTTEILGVFGLKTDSRKAVEKLFKDAEKRIEENSQFSPK